VKPARHAFRPLLPALLALLALSAVPRGADAQTGWLPTSWFSPSEIDPQAMFPLAENDGPWLVLATTFRGEGARDDARRLVQELRRDHEVVRQQKEKMESELVHLSNENLQNEIAHKSAQLANSTMAMVRKNEVLGEIKQELDSQKHELGARMPTKYYNRLTRLIDQEMKNESEWEAFEALYDQAHGDFFKRLKADFPGLTPSDLRLCAYLRMNLSSKEIAPLLNITVRGVEERRYRLRKRMNLGSDENLTERIMTY
jgi:DNA-binding CsgD family transcriptional regulator